MRHILNGTTSRIAYAVDSGIVGAMKGWMPFGSRQNPTQVQQPQRSGKPDTSGANDGGDDEKNNGNKGAKNNGANDEGDEDNHENFLAKNEDLWNDNQDENSETPEQIAARSEQTKQSNQALSDYINGLDFKLEIDPAKFAEALEKGDGKFLNSLFNNALQRVFGKAITDMGKLLSSAEDRMSEKMQNIANTHISARESETSLFKEVPIAQKALLKPVALAMKGRFLKKGMNDDEANAAVKRAFQAIRQAPAEQLGGDDDDDITKPLNGNRRVTNKNEIDWIEELTRS